MSISMSLHIDMHTEATIGCSLESYKVSRVAAEIYFRVADAVSPPVARSIFPPQNHEVQRNHHAATLP